MFKTENEKLSKNNEQKNNARQQKGVVEIVNELTDRAVDFAADKLDKAQDFLEDIFE